MIRTLTLSVMSAALFATAASSRAQQAANAAADEEPKLVVKVYRVLDLVTPAPNYPYEGTYLPGGARSVGSLSFGGTGGGMGGMGGGMGGGMFRVEDQLAQVGGGRGGSSGGGVGGVGSGPATTPAAGNRHAGMMQINVTQLIDTITSIVEPQSWEEAGGGGAIQPIGGALAVRQTPAVQAQVQEFLQLLSRESGTLRSLTIKARWLALDNDQLAALVKTPKASKSTGAPPTVDRDALKALPAETQRFAGQITCFNGQTVHIVSGELESVVQGFIPIAGGNEVGYQPIVLTPHLGVLLQVTPTILPGEESVFVDVHSSVTRWDRSSSDRQQKPSDRPKGSNVAQYPAALDRLRLDAQQLATCVRAPLDQILLVGGMSFPSKEPSKQDAQLYLQLEVRSDQSN
jgi:hypothetical protein